MKAICIAMVLAGVSTPALAREAHHHKHVRHRHALDDGRVATVWRGDSGARTLGCTARAPGIALDASPSQGAYAEMVARHAAANGVPVSLVHRVIMRESRYNPRAISQGNYGIMQIRLSTARAMGYTGSASGLLDPEVNMTYAVKYLAGLIRLQAAARAAPLRTTRAATITKPGGGVYRPMRRRAWRRLPCSHQHRAFVRANELMRAAG